jgi:hypothetical protein
MLNKKTLSLKELQLSKSTDEFAMASICGLIEQTMSLFDDDEDTSQEQVCELRDGFTQEAAEMIEDGDRNGLMMFALRLKRIIEED